MKTPATPQADVAHGYTGPAVVRLHTMPDNRWNGTRVRIVGWHPNEAKCYVRYGRRTMLLHPGVAGDAVRGDVMRRRRPPYWSLDSPRPVDSLGGGRAFPVVPHNEQDPLG